MSFSSTGAGGTVEEEMEGFRAVVEVVLGEIQRSEASMQKEAKGST